MNKFIRSEKGSAILIVMGLIAMLTAIAIMSVNRSNTDMDLSYNQLHEEQAFYIAEAGLSRAVVEINSDNNWRAGYDKEEFQDGYYSVTIIDSSVQLGLGDTVIMQSTSQHSGAGSNLEIWLVPGKKRPFKHAAFADASMLVQNDACTDSYDSDSGTYAETQDSLGSDLGSNGTILVQNNAVIGGDVSTATAGGLTIKDLPNIAGDTTSTAPPEKLDLIADADYDWAKANNKAPLGIIGTGYEWKPGPEIIVQSGETITLTSGVYYFSYLQLKNNAKVVLAPGADVKIYMTGNFLIENGATMNEGGIPSKLSVFSNVTTNNGVIFKNDSEFRGTVYAPEVDFLHDNNANLYGAIIAKSVIIANMACIHYDRALANMDMENDGTMRQVAWRQN